MVGNDARSLTVIILMGNVRGACRVDSMDGTVHPWSAGCLLGENMARIHSRPHVEHLGLAFGQAGEGNGAGKDGQSV